MKLHQPVSTGKKWFNFSSTNDASTRIDIYDMIGQDPWTGEGVSAKSFVQELNATTGPVDIHLNSEGGYVWDGLAIFEAIAQYPDAKTAYIDGLAASAASFIAMACDTVLIGKRARMMVHDAAGGGGVVWNMSAQQVQEFIDGMVELKDQLDDMSNNIADIYAEKAGGTRAEWRTKMQAGKDNSGTWFDAEAAVTIGLANGIIGEEAKKEPEAEATDWWDPAAFSNMMKGVFDHA